SLTSLSSLQVSRHQIPNHGLIPNTFIQNKPLLIYRSCIPVSASTSSIELHLKAVGAAISQWRYTMYRTAHFRSTTREVLRISNGNAKLYFGGERNQDRVEVEVKKGDVVIVLAGVGHRLLDDFESGFEMVGSYPKGRHWDMYYGKEGEEKVQSIEKLEWFEKDPVYGDEGPALQI
ncbi:hypothetical protein B0O99DRAFT_516597, partial [Bisporella sp. PMI_857]